MAALLVLVVVLLSVSGPGWSGSVRVGRSVLELSGVIKCSTGRHALAYSLYGCYCGLGGQGWPRDNADWCCQRHDCCYAKAQDSGCHTKPQQYRWSCSTDLPDCGSLADGCEKTVCLCDTEVARCLKKAAYNLEYAVYPDFLCGAEYPTCAYT